MPRRRLLLHHHQTAYEPETLELPEEVVIPKKNAPSVNGTLRQTALRVPEVTWQCSGIMVFGKKIRSLVFSTDLAIIKNINADAVIAVYPFTPQPIINEALLMASDIPVFTGVGGGLTKGHRVVNLAMYAEMQGAMGVVVNVPTSGLVISRMRRTIDIPIVVTVANHGTDYARRIDDGAAIFNVAAGSATAEIVAEIRTYPSWQPEGQATRASCARSTPGPTPSPIPRPLRRSYSSTRWNATGWAFPTNKIRGRIFCPRFQRVVCGKIHRLGQTKRRLFSIWAIVTNCIV